MYRVVRAREQNMLYGGGFSSHSFFPLGTFCSSFLALLLSSLVFWANLLREVGNYCYRFFVVIDWMDSVVSFLFQGSLSFSFPFVVSSPTYFSFLFFNTVILTLNLLRHNKTSNVLWKSRNRETIEECM